MNPEPEQAQRRGNQAMREAVIRRADDGSYLESYDPDYTQDDGTGRSGYAEWTPDPAKAMRFASNAAAMLAYTTVSATRPLRPDGKPNRPLTRWTVVVEAAP